jgi:hypothetical protein
MMLAPVLAVLSALSAVDVAEPDLLAIEQALLVPEANLTWSDGRLRLHPKLMAQAVTGAVRYQDQGWTDDPSWGGVAGVEARWAPIREQRLTAEVLGGVITSTGSPAHEDWRGLVRVGWQRASPTLATQAHGSMRLDQQELIYAAQNVRLIANELGGGGTYEGNHVRAQAGLVVRAERYLDAGAVGEGDHRDWQGVVVPVNLSWQSTSRLRLIVAPVYESYDFVSGSRNPYGNVTRLTAGGEVLPGEHVRLSLLLGVAWWQWQGDYAGDPDAGGAQVVVPDTGLTATWEWSKHDQLTLMAGQGSQPGVSATTVTVEHLGIREEHHFDQRWRLSVEGSCVRVRDQQGRYVALASKPEQRNGSSAMVAVDYVHQQGWRLRGFASADDSRMRYSVSYERWAVGLQTFMIW